VDGWMDGCCKEGTDTFLKARTPSLLIRTGVRRVSGERDEWMAILFVALLHSLARLFLVLLAMHGGDDTH